MFCNNGLDLMHDEHSTLLVPNGDTVFYHCSKFDELSVDEITELMNNGLRVIIDYGFKIYPLMRSRKVRLAIDKHDRRYYGDENHIYVCFGKKERGTMKRFTYITCSVVTRGIRFIIGALPLIDKEGSLNAIDCLISQAVKKFRIDCVLMDRGFNNIDIVNYFQNRKMHFIMAQKKLDTIKEWMRKTEDLKAKIIKNFKIGTKNRYTLTNLILVDDNDGLKRAFITNMEFGEQIAHYAFLIYRDRWGIETCYRQLEEDFNIKTRTESYNIRLFFFLFATCLFNLWVLINLGIGIATTGKPPEKPLITGKRLTLCLYKLTIDPPT
jgi:hypothetical protein